MIRKLAYGLAALIITVTSVFVFLPARKASAAFDPNMIMSDSVFENTGTMSAADIDAFLNRFGSSCISPNSGFRDFKPLGWSTTNNRYEFSSSTVTAGEIISSAANFYHVNPQVLLATVQKEQSLVTGGAGCYYEPNKNEPFSCDLWGNGRTYNCTDACHHSGGCINIAVGNQCPYYCDANYEGFSMQLISGAWTLRFGQQRSLGHIRDYAGYDAGDDVLRYSIPMVQGTRQRNTDEEAVYWDGYYTPGDGGSVTITTGATAALYRYTPFKSGNSNFVNIFENTFGFGSTVDGRPLVPHPDGTMVRPAGSPGVRWNFSGGKKAVTSQAVFLNSGYSWENVKLATQGDNDLAIVAGSPMKLREGSLVKGSGPGIYIIENSDGIYGKRGFASWDVFVGLGYQYRDVFTIDDSQLPSTIETIDTIDTVHPDGTLVRPEGQSGVYLLQNGNRVPFPNPQVLYSYGYNWEMVKDATDEDVALPLGTALYYREGTLLKGSGPGIYAVDYEGTTIRRRSFSSWQVFSGLGYTLDEVINVSDSALPSTTGPIIGQ
jgi:hypothetical protein